MAGFEVTLHGWFWVTPEAIAACLLSLTAYFWSLFTRQISLILDN
jgi:hypothetical protein